MLDLNDEEVKLVKGGLATLLANVEWNIAYPYDNKEYYIELSNQIKQLISKLG